MFLYFQIFSRSWWRRQIVSIDTHRNRFPNRIKSRSFVQCIYTHIDSIIIIVVYVCHRKFNHKRDAWSRNSFFTVSLSPLLPSRMMIGVLWGKNAIESVVHEHEQFNFLISLFFFIFFLSISFSHELMTRELGKNVTNVYFIIHQRSDFSPNNNTSTTCER